MMSNIYRVAKPEHGSQEWLNVRWRDDNGLARISASVASCVHGSNLYKSGADLAIELLQDTAPYPTEATSAMERGNRLEPVLLQWFADLEQIEVIVPDEMFAYESDDRMVRLIATLDGVSSNGIPIEVKTTRKMWDGVLPETWYWQGVQQAMCTGVPRIEWAIFDSNLELHRYTQIVSSDEMKIHEDACREFLGHIDQGMIPPNASMTYDNVSTLYPTVGEGKELPPSAVELIRMLDYGRRMKTEGTELEEEAKKQIGLLLQGCDHGTIDGDIVVTWKQFKKKSFDLATFTANQPALAEKYTKYTEYRTMKTTRKDK